MRRPRRSFYVQLSAQINSNLDHQPASLTFARLSTSAHYLRIVLLFCHKPSHRPESIMKIFAIFAFLLAALFGTGNTKIYQLWLDAH